VNQSGSIKFNFAGEWSKLNYPRPSLYIYLW
jgi:hypothetical protein